MPATAAFEFRKARASDKQAVLALCAKIWDGDDYIPSCYDDWVADGSGEFALCLFEGRLAGLGKLTRLSPGQVWLEGLRKDPDLPVKGLGEALVRRFLTGLAGEAGLESVRFSTYFDKAASIRLNQGLGFRRIATASIKHIGGKELQARASARRHIHAVPDSGVQVLRDIGPILDFISRSGQFGSFIHEAWKSRAYSAALFAERYVEAGACVGVVQAGRLLALAAFTVDAEKGSGALPFFDALDWRSGARLMTEVEAMLARRGVPEAEAIVPEGGNRALRILDSLGWRSWERESDYLVFELPLELLPSFAAPPAS